MYRLIIWGLAEKLSTFYENVNTRGSAVYHCKVMLLVNNVVFSDLPLLGWRVIEKLVGNWISYL